MKHLMLIALLLAASQAGSARAEVLRPGQIEPFETRPQDARSLAWLERWLADNQPDDIAAYNSAMSFALSTSERRQVRDKTIGADPHQSMNAGYSPDPSHLAKIHYMAEIRWSASLSNSTVPGIDNPARPRWQTRHLCAGVLVAADWVLTAAACVTPEKLAAGIEAALGTSDLARDDALVRPVDRIAVHLGAGLALLHLGGTAAGYDERSIAPATLEPETIVPVSPDSDRKTPMPKYSVLGWGRHTNAAGRPIAPYRYSVVRTPYEEGCVPADAAKPGICLTNHALKFCREDSGGPVYNYDWRGGARLVGIVSWDQSACFITGAITSKYNEVVPEPAAPIIQLAPYRDWLEQVTGSNETGQAQVVPQPAPN